MVHEILEVASGCPYDTWVRPNLRWCEAMQCGYVVTPLNAYSNIAYLIASYLVLSQFWKTSDSSFPTKFATTMAACGVGSFAYHATYTFLFQMADFLGMFAFTAMCLAASTSSTPKVNMGHYWGHLITSCVVMAACLHFNIKYQLIIASQIVAIVFLERRHIGRDMGTAMLFMLLAGLASASDQSGLLCDPHSWFQGHAVWHLLSSVGMYFTYMHYHNKRNQKMF